MADIRTGVDPASAKENERIANLTLQEVLNEFLEQRNLKYWSRFSYRSAIERHLSDWLQLPVRKITRDMVEERHKAIPGPTRCGTEGEVRANTTFRILRCILRWTADHYQVDGKPLLESNPVSRLTVLMASTTKQGRRDDGG